MMIDRMLIVANMLTRYFLVIDKDLKNVHQQHPHEHLQTFIFLCLTLMLMEGIGC